MLKTNEQIIIETMKNEEYLNNLKIRPYDVLKAITLAQKEVRELEHIIDNANKNNESLSDLCNKLNGHNEEFINDYPSRSYFDLNYKSLLVTVIQERDVENKLQPIKLSKNDTYIYPDNISEITSDELFILDLEKRIDINKIWHIYRYSLNENKENIEIGYKKFYEVFKAYYNDVNDLCARLQDDYNGGPEFEQDDQDRLALCMLCDLFDAVEIGDYNNELFDEVITNNDSEELELE